MSRGALLPLLLLAACSFNSPDGDDGDDDPGPDPDPTDTDGDGVVADDNCPNMPNPDQKDADKDGVGDTCDNCPDAKNPPKATMGAGGVEVTLQRDHDGDGHGDECDLCPHLRGGTSDMDGDGDLIGDACDPEPTVQNPAPYWNGFYEPPDSNWTVATNGGALDDWELALQGDKLGWRQKTLDDGRHQLIYMTGQQEHYVQSSIVGGQLMANADTASATVTYGYGASGGNAAWFSCGPRHNRTGNMDVIISAVQYNDIDQKLDTGDWSGGFLGAAIDVTGRGERVGSTQPMQGSSSLACSASSGATTVQAMTTSAYIPDGLTGLRTYAMTAWFDFIFIVEPRPRP